MAVIASYRLINNQVVSHLISTITKNWLPKWRAKQPMIVQICDKDESRSHAQNRLYWKWLTQYGNHIGLSKDEAHILFKKQFLIKIYARDDAEFNEMCQTIRTLKQSEHEHWQVLANHVIRETSTTKASVAQMTEYLNDIFAFCYSQGLYLTVPEDLRNIASKEWLRG